MAIGIKLEVTGVSTRKDTENVPTLEVNLSKGKAQIKKGKHVDLLICMVIKMVPQVLVCVAAS